MRKLFQTIGRFIDAAFNLSDITCDWSDELKSESDIARLSLQSDRTKRLEELGIQLPD
jgi:hypothetical protein